MLLLLVDEDNTGASLCAELVVRAAIMQRGATHKVMSAGRCQKKAGRGADDAWRAAARSAGLSLDKAQSRPLAKKDLKRADRVIALEAETADGLHQQGFEVVAWTVDGGWTPTQQTVEALARRAQALLDEVDA